MLGNPSAVVIGADGIPGGGDAVGSMAVAEGAASDGSVGGSGVALTIGSGAPPVGTPTMSALVEGRGDLFE